MKTMNIIIIAMIALLALTGSVMADARVNATPETQTITTTTTIEAMGAVSNIERMAWVITNQAGVDTADSVGGVFVASYPLAAGEIMYQSTYSDTLTVDDGYTLFSKQVDKINTGNQVLEGKNVEMLQSLKYDSADTFGTATLEEQITIDGSGNVTPTASSFMCIFAAAKSSTVPMYCNFATAGSKISQVTLTSTETSASESFIGSNSDYPVTLSYGISAKGFGTDPMLGIATSNARVSIKEARNGTAQSEALDWTDNARASGQINTFGKTYAYRSGLRLV
jgi:hypothetical protein